MHVLLTIKKRTLKEKQLIVACFKYHIQTTLTVPSQLVMDFDIWKTWKTYSFENISQTEVLICYLYGLRLEIFKLGTTIGLTGL